MGTIMIFFEASGFIGMLYLINGYFGGKHVYSKYWIGFLLTCGILFAFKSDAHAYQFGSFEYDNFEYPEFNFDREILTEYERKILTENLKKSERNAHYHYNLAKDRCWWLPDISDREKARYCFQGAVQGLIGTTPQSKVVGAIIYFLTTYGIACLDEWNFINDNLMKSQVWWESYEFYKYALEHG